MILNLPTLQVNSSSHLSGDFSTYLINCDTADLEGLLFDSCPGCQKANMSAIPQGVFAAQQIHINNMKSFNYSATVSKRGGIEKSGTNPTYQQVNTQNLDHPLAKYNSKMMNSIWGMYNRYSVHNLKKITEGAEAPEGEQQQFIAAATPASLGYGIKGGFTNNPLTSPTWELFTSNGHTY